MHGFPEDRELNALLRIGFVKGLYDDQVKKVKKEEHIRELLQEDYIRTIRGYMTRWDYVYIFKDAQSQIGEKLKKNRPQLETLKEFMAEDFLNNDKSFKLTNIISCGYEGYAWNIYYEYSYGVNGAFKKEFYISIPVKSKITSKNIDHAHHGMFSFAVKEFGPCECWHVTKMTYEVNDMAKFIKEYFELDKED